MKLRKSNIYQITLENCTLSTLETLQLFQKNNPVYCEFLHLERLKGNISFVFIKFSDPKTLSLFSLIFDISKIETIPYFSESTALLAKVEWLCDDALGMYNNIHANLTNIQQKIHSAVAIPSHLLQP